MRYQSSSNCGGFVYMNDLKSGGNGHGNKLSFQTFTRLATYSKTEHILILTFDAS